MLYLKDSKIHGKGVFHHGTILQDEDFECPIIVLNQKELIEIQFTCLADKLFQIEETAGVVLSPLCMANHSSDPNMSYRADSENNVVVFTALRNIPSGEEILIDYKDFAKVLGLD